MKKLLLPILLAAALLSANALTAKDFEGTIKMSITDGRSKAMPLEYSIKTGLLRTDIQAEEGMTATAIMDFAKEEMIMLMPGQPMYMVMSMKRPVAEAKEQKGEDVVIEKTGETETIIGYKCTKYIATSKDAVTEIWATEELGGFMGLGNAMGGPMGKGAAPQSWEKAVVGKNFFPLRVISTTGKKQKFRMDVTAVDQKSLPASFFAPPAGYQKFDMGGMMKGMGGSPFGR